MRNGYTHISMILDRSGSMKSLVSDAIGGFNSFVAEQKKLSGQVTMSVVQFDDGYETLHNFKPLNEIPDLTLDTYVPRGTTALRDAIGTTMQNTGVMLETMKEEDRPEKVIIVVITDGLENASRLYGAEQIHNLIKHQTEVYNWQFVFIGSNQDAILSAGQLGIQAQAALTYDPNGQSVKMSYDALSRSVGSLRLGITKSIVFTDEDRKKVKH